MILFTLGFLTFKVIFKLFQIFKMFILCLLSLSLFIMYKWIKMVSDFLNIHIVVAKYFELQIIISLKVFVFMKLKMITKSKNKKA